MWPIDRKNTVSILQVASQFPKDLGFYCLETLSQVELRELFSSVSVEGKET